MTLKHLITAAALGLSVMFMAFGAAPVLAQSAPPKAAPLGALVGAAAPLAAPTTAVAVNQTGGTTEPTAEGFSIVHMFINADIIVKAVMSLLFLSSLWSWAIIINKWLALRSVQRQASQFEKTFWSGLSLDELNTQIAARNEHPMSAVFTAALREWKRAFENGPPRESRLGGIKERIEKAMSVTILRETDGLEHQLGFLATVGATAPFVGLFGTVWGIMNAFSAIAARHNTTLSVVAPGIAEALFATAMGLLAAIPAVIFYNWFTNQIVRYTGRLEAFADEFSAILGRQLDEKAVR